ncbi:MAG: hypothetical protein Q7U36_02245 [bacterium]|nr:hypothetical protein [bacterium]
MTIQEMQSYLVMSVLVNAVFFVMILILGYKLKKRKDKLSQEVLSIKNEMVDNVVADFNYCFQVIMNNIYENIHDNLHETFRFCGLKADYNHFVNKYKNDLAVLFEKGIIFSKALSHFCDNTDFEKSSPIFEKIEEIIAVLSLKTPIDFEVNNFEQLKELSDRCERMKYEWKALLKKMEPVAEPM